MADTDTEPNLKSIPFGLLLRSFFAGGFFPISYYVASHPAVSYQGYHGIELKDVLSIGVPVALFAGVTVYAFHRSVTYPFLLEWWLDSEPLKSFRDKEFGNMHPFRLITKTTIERIRKRWVMFATPRSPTLNACASLMLGLTSHISSIAQHSAFALERGSGNRPAQGHTRQMALSLLSPLPFSWLALSQIGDYVPFL
jgi:hypothetical protein